MQPIFQLVQRIEGVGLVPTFIDPERGADLAEAMAVRGHPLNLGQVGGGQLRAELRGQPKFIGTCGPMWGGHTEEGRPIVRYETVEAYEILTA